MTHGRESYLSQFEIAYLTPLTADSCIDLALQPSSATANGDIITTGLRIRHQRQRWVDEMLSYTPTRQRPAPLRKLTPSPQKIPQVSPLKRRLISSSHRVADVSPPKCQKGDADARQVPDQIQHFPRPIVEFCLVSDGVARPPSDDEFRILKDSFPTANSVSVTPPLLIVEYHKLPPKPWPLSIAGLPVFITSEENCLGFGFGRQGGRKKALPHYNATRHVNEEIFMAAIDYFETQLEVFITSIVHLAGRWLTTVPDDTKLSELPWLLASAHCTYEFASEQEEPQEAAFGKKVPNNLVWDSSSYEDIRPGVMVSSGGDDQDDELLTTSGVLVEDLEGNRFFTVASHGFPRSRLSVYHPNKNGEIIGLVDHEIKDSNIALAKLAPGMQYKNETFAANVDDEMIPPFRISGIRDGMDVPYYTCVTMNNPFIGHRDGMVVGSARTKIPSDEATVDHTWMKVNWYYFGNGIEPSQGSCGSAILDEDGKVVSFFRFLLNKYPAVAWVFRLRFWRIEIIVWLMNERR
ncbi:hypothetical protein FQN50_008608 [Emmonsiellopsis sp. PD_5]|nr:hypothetical protein FQN50_008608 [Emmonsiellopsis sp. PD_5]